MYVNHTDSNAAGEFPGAKLCLHETRMHEDFWITCYYAPVCSAGGAWRPCTYQSVSMTLDLDCDRKARLRQAEERRLITYTPYTR